MKKPVGSQHSFSNLDGARASIDSADRLSISSERPEEVEADEADEEEGTVSSPAASPESHVPDEPDESDEFEKIWHGLTAKWTKELDEKIKKEKGEEEENETTVTNDPMSTLGPTRNPTDPEVTTEPTNHNRCQRPLQRARERREARLKKESDALAELDPHAGQQRSSLSSAQEQDCVHPQSSSESLPHDPAVEGWKPGETYSAGDEVPADVGRACWACNAYGADVEWHQHEGIAMCRRCVDDYRTSESGRSLLLQLKVGYEERQNSQ